MANIYFELVEKNKFKIMLAYTKDYVYYARFCDSPQSRAAFINYLNTKYDKVIKNPLKSDYSMIIENYFDGIRMQPDLPYKLAGKSKHNDVLNEAIKIKYGQIMTYDEFIKETGKEFPIKLIKESIRENNISVIIPTHRLINDNKLLYVFSDHDRIQFDLLKLEGHKLEKKGRKNGQKKLYIIKE